MANKKITVKLPKARIFREEVHFSLRKLVIFLIVFASIGGFFLWRSLAAEPLIATVEAETLTLSGGAKVFTAQHTSSGTAVAVPVAASISGDVNLPSNATSITVNARGKLCNSTQNQMSVELDGKQVLSSAVNTSRWTNFSASISATSGIHKITVKNAGDASTVSGCETKLFVDAVYIYGTQPVATPAPTVAISASPNTMVAGNSSTIAWTTKDATSCSASGSWSGTQPTSGSINTGALNNNATYTLSCQGPGGGNTASASIAVTAPITSTASSLPPIGISTGYKILSRSATDRAFELDKIKKVFNGHPGYIRTDAVQDSYWQSQLGATITDMMSRGITPFVALYGTTGPRSVDTFGRDQAIKWNGKVKFFEVANEPDINGWTPDSYADFVKGTAASVKSGNPNAVVIAGALWKGEGTPYTTQDYCKALATRAKGSFDMLSIHLYDDPKSRGDWNIWDRAFPVLFGANSYYKGNTCREILNNNGLASVPIISTETGGPTTKYGESGQSTIISNDFDALRSGLLPSMAVYSMMDDDVPGFGLLRPDKTERPAYATFMNRAY